MKSRLLTITLAAVLAMLGMVAVLAYVHQANERAVNGLKAETVWVAKGAIPAGTSLNDAQHENLLMTEKVPDSSLSTSSPFTSPVRSVTKTNEKLVMSADVAQGQVLLQNMLVPAANVTASGTFALPAGMVAVTVQMCVQESVAKYITPNSYVAVFDTLAYGKSVITRTCDPSHEIINPAAIVNGKSVRTQIVLAKAKVLAVGQNPGGQGTSGASNLAVTTDPSSSSSSSQDSVLVTLAVSQADAEKLILIDEVGLPYMALLGPDSKTSFNAPPIPLFSPSP